MTVNVGVAANLAASYLPLVPATSAHHSVHTGLHLAHSTGSIASVVALFYNPLGSKAGVKLLLPLVPPFWR